MNGARHFITIPYRIYIVRGDFWLNTLQGPPNYNLLRSYSGLGFYDPIPPLQLMTYPIYDIVNHIPDMVFCKSHTRYGTHTVP